MKITVENIEIKKDQYEAIVKLNGLTTDLSYGNYDRRAIERMTIEKIVEKLTSDFLQKHTHEILSKIDQQQILNMIVLNYAKKIQS